jgi:hypothetical protein
MLENVYIDTTIPSFATCHPRPENPSVTFFKNSTLFFWENMSQKFNLFVSSYVVRECVLGDSDAARRRMEFIDGISTIQESDQIKDLALKYMDLLGIPERAKMDCSHLAASVISEMDYLLSWNLKHFSINNYYKILKYNDNHGLTTPFLFTPAELAAICLWRDHYGI